MILIVVAETCHIRLSGGCHLHRCSVIRFGHSNRELPLVRIADVDFLMGLDDCDVMLIGWFCRRQLKNVVWFAATAEYPSCIGRLDIFLNPANPTPRDSLMIKATVFSWHFPARWSMIQVAPTPGSRSGRRPLCVRRSTVRTCIHMID